MIEKRLILRRRWFTKYWWKKFESCRKREDL